MIGICFFQFKKLHLKKQMIMINQIVPLFLSMLLFVGCHKKDINKTSSSSTVSDSKKQIALPEIKNAIVDTELDISNMGAMYSVDSLRINKDTLSVFVNYSGGCKEHVFDLYSNGNYAKSLPPQLSLFLKHNSNDDACRELIMKELKFNVSNLKYPGKNTVILKLGSNKITYTSN